MLVMLKPCGVHSLTGRLGGIATVVILFRLPMTTGPGHRAPGPNHDHGERDRHPEGAWTLCLVLGGPGYLVTTAW